MDIWGVITGAAGIKFFEKLYTLASNYYDKRVTAKKVIEKNIDPILKATDELASKLYYYIKDDFQCIKPLPTNEEIQIPQDSSLLNTYFLFSQFWCRLQIFREESIFVEICSEKNGEMLNDFIRCLESKSIQLFRRNIQRVIGEILIKDSNKCMNYFEFTKLFMNDTKIRMWYKSLEEILNDSVENKRARQKIIKFYIILRSLIDTLDPKHITTRPHKSVHNKLNKISKRDLKYKIFKKYLSFVEKPESFYAGITDKN